MTDAQTLTELGTRAAASLELRAPTAARATVWSDGLAVVELSIDGEFHALHVEGDTRCVRLALEQMIAALLEAAAASTGKACGQGAA